MKKSRFIYCLALLVTMLSLQSCGSDTADGSATFDTVLATASVDSTKNPLLADLVTWKGDPCATDATTSIVNDVVNFTITTKSLNLGKTNPLVLQKATITLTPADTLSPVLPALYSPTYLNLIGTVVPAEGTLSVPVEVITHNLKSYFVPKLVCTSNSPVYSYYATIAFEAVERDTGRSEQFSAGMTVRFADFVDK